MLNLLKANFYKLVKERLLYILIIISVILAFMVLSIFKVGADALEEVSGMSISFLTVPLSLFSTGYCSLVTIIGVSIFIGKEFQNGAIRNKIACGYSRKSIYFVSLITSLVYTLIIFGITILFSIVFGNLIMGNADVTFPLFEVIIVYLLGFCFTLSFTAVACTIGLLTRSNNMTLLVNILSAMIIFPILSLIVQLAGSNEFFKDIAPVVREIIPYFSVDALSNYLTDFSTSGDAILSGFIGSAVFIAICFLLSFLFDKLDIK